MSASYRRLKARCEALEQVNEQLRHNNLAMSTCIASAYSAYFSGLEPIPTVLKTVRAGIRAARVAQGYRVRCRSVKRCA